MGRVNSTNRPASERATSYSLPWFGRSALGPTALSPSRPPPPFQHLVVYHQRFKSQISANNHFFLSLLLFRLSFINQRGIKTGHGAAQSSCTREPANGNRRVYIYSLFVKRLNGNVHLISICKKNWPQPGEKTYKTQPQPSRGCFFGFGV